MSDEDDIILSELDDDELVQQMHDDLYDGLQDEIVEGDEIIDEVEVPHSQVEQQDYQSNSPKSLSAGLSNVGRECLPNDHS